MKQYSFHIEFVGHSNPFYHFPCDRKTYKAALAQWRRLYNLELISKSGTLTFYRATPKTPPAPQTFLSWN